MGKKNLYLLREGCIQYIKPKRLTKQKAIEKILEGYNIFIRSMYRFYLINTQRRKTQFIHRKYRQ